MKVGHKSRRGRKRNGGTQHRDHRKGGRAPGSDRRRQKAQRRRRLQELRTPEIEL